MTPDFSRTGDCTRQPGREERREREGVDRPEPPAGLRIEAGHDRPRRDDGEGQRRKQAELPLPQPGEAGYRDRTGPGLRVTPQARRERSYERPPPETKGAPRRSTPGASRNAPPLPSGVLLSFRRADRGAPKAPPAAPATIRAAGRPSPPPRLGPEERPGAGPPLPVRAAAPPERRPRVTRPRGSNAAAIRRPRRPPPPTDPATPTGG